MEENYREENVSETDLNRSILKSVIPLKLKATLSKSLEGFFVP